MSWSRCLIDEQSPCACTVCGRVIPDKSILNGDVLYSPSSKEGVLTTEEEQYIEAEWGVVPYADFNLCQACVRDSHLPPTHFLKSYQEHEEKERLKALAIIDAMSKTPNLK